MKKFLSHLSFFGFFLLLVIAAYLGIRWSSPFSEYWKFIVFVIIGYTAHILWAYMTE